MAPAKKGKTKKARTSRSSMGKLMAPVDITTSSQLSELDKRIASGPFTLVFVYADWCGHCQRFKPNMTQLETMPERSIQTARVRDDVFPQSSLSNTTIDGYPSLLLVKPNGEVTKFKDEEGDVKNTIPDYTNMTNMKAIVKNVGTPAGTAALNASAGPAEPAEVAAVTARANTAAANTTRMNTAMANTTRMNTAMANTPRMNTVMANPVNTETVSGTATGSTGFLNSLMGVTEPKPETVKTAVTGTVKAPSGTAPTNIVADRLSSKSVSLLNSQLVESKNALLKASTKPVVKGGSLFSALSSASAELAPSAVLLYGATFANKKRSGTKRQTRRRSTRKGRSSRRSRA